MHTFREQTIKPATVPKGDKLKRILGRVCAIFYRALTMGRVQGTSYILRKPSTFRVSKGNHIVIGNNVMIDKDARIIAHGGNIVIGDDTFIGKNSTLIAFADLFIGNRVLIGENSSIHTENHGGPGERDSFTSGPIVVNDDVWLGAGVVVTAGRTIASGATVGANSVVTKDLEEPALYAGVPAKLIRVPEGKTSLGR